MRIFPKYRKKVYMFLYLEANFMFFMGNKTMCIPKENDSENEFELVK